ncbi:MAG: hypothetical protein BRD47_07290, partial [Bacteroidetes bacterium QS_8_68_28]
EGQEDDEAENEPDLMRSSSGEKQHQLTALRNFHGRGEGRSEDALQRLKHAAREGENVFAELMETVKTCSLGQITQALFAVGGEYRRNM